MSLSTPSYPRRSPQADPDGRADRVARGSLSVDKQVLEKIAGQAAAEIGAAGGRSGGFLGFGAGTDLSARPKVGVELSGQHAVVEVDLAVAYPASIRRSTAQVRDRVIDRLRQLAGVTVTRLDITVTALQQPAVRQTAGQRPRERKLL